MMMNIDYPTEEQISGQKRKVLDSVFREKEPGGHFAGKRSGHRRPGPRIVFFECRLAALISLAIYALLLVFCYLSSPEKGGEGFLALAVFPGTYFSFYFLSLLNEDQLELIDLKRSLPCSFFYLVSLRMFYTSLAAIFLNLLLLLACFGRVGSMWSAGAAGTTSLLLFALISIRLYERTGRARQAAVLYGIWCGICLFLVRFGGPVYHLVIEIVPFAVHLAAAAFSLAALAGYCRKVEIRNAYGF